MSNTNIKKVRTSDLELKDRLVSIQRVTKVTKGGRTFSFSAIVVVGNEDGVVGYGLGKASEVQSAIAKGVEDAKKNLVKIPVINGTIPHKQELRFGGSLVMIRPAAPGTGIIAGGAMRAVLESVGVKNVLAKSKGSSNPHNLVKAPTGLSLTNTSNAPGPDISSVPFTYRSLFKKKENRCRAYPFCGAAKVIAPAVSASSTVAFASVCSNGKVAFNRFFASKGLPFTLRLSARIGLLTVNGPACWNCVTFTSSMA